MGISTTTTVLKLPEGHCSLFFTSREPQESRSSPSGIPTESFLSIMDQLFEVDLVRASHVCKSWREAILGCSRLWSVLEDVNIRRFTVVERVRTFASRSKGNLRKISFNVDYTEVPLAQVPVVAIMHQIFRDIARLDGARSLQSLALDLLSYEDGDDALGPAYKCVALAAQFAELSAINLREFIVESVLPEFSSGAPFWLNLPSLKHLSVSCRGDDSIAVPDYFDTGADTEDLAKISISKLGRISFVGTKLGEIYYPEFPHLTSLNLSEMTVTNLYGFLLKCAKTLTYLDLRDVSSVSPSRHLPNPTPNTANVVTKDLPLVLSLPALKKLRICGEGTPLLWATPTETTISFTCDTPVLELVDFSPKEHSDPNGGGGYDDIEACDTLTASIVKTLFRRSPQLGAVNFRRTNLDVSMLVNALPEATSFLTYLSIGGTAACNDSTIDRLAALTPQLRVLDVWEPMLEGSRTPSIQALARFAEAMLEVSPSRRVGGNENWSLKIIADGLSLPVREYISNLDKVLQELKSLLPILSTSQFSYLGSSLEFKPHPTTISSISTTRPLLTFASIRNELETFVIPPDEPPFAKPFPPKRGDPGYFKPEETETDIANSSEKVNILVAKKKKKGKKNGPNGRDIAAPIDIVKQAEKLLQEWVEKREIQASLEWFKGQEEKGGGGGGKVRIEWGSDECGAAGCGEDECACKIWTQDWEQEKLDDCDESEEEMEVNA
ncbi:hypothetical protein JCM16303_002540 [Sporobolomyces ruberrimus]